MNPNELCLKTPTFREKNLGDNPRCFIDLWNWGEGNRLRTEGQSMPSLALLNMAAIVWCCKKV